MENVFEHLDCIDRYNSLAERISTIYNENDDSRCNIDLIHCRARHTCEHNSKKCATLIMMNVWISRTAPIKSLHIFECFVCVFNARLLSKSCSKMPNRTERSSKLIKFPFIHCSCYLHIANALPHDQHIPHMRKTFCCVDSFCLPLCFSSGKQNPLINIHRMLWMCECECHAFRLILVGGCLWKQWLRVLAQMLSLPRYLCQASNNCIS